MKKVALLISLMLVFTLASFAQIDVTVTGSSTATLGIALDEPVASGFINENDAKIAFSLVKKDTVTKGAEEDVYGFIEIKDFQYSYKTGDNSTSVDPGWTIKAGNVTAKIMFPMGWVKISGTTTGFNFVNPVQDDDGDKNNADKGLDASLGKSGGVVLGLDLAPLAVELGVFSETDWTVDNNYGASLKLTVDVAPVKAEVGVVMPLNYATDERILLGGKVTADVAPVKIYVAADVEIVEPENNIELGGGISLALMDGLAIAVDGTYGVDAVDNTDVKVSITEDGEGGAIPGLGITLTAEIFNILGASAGTNPDLDDDVEYAVALGLNYKTEMMKPYLNVRYGTYTEKDNTYTYVAAEDEPFKLNIGVELYLITNVVFTIDYNSDNILPDTANQSNGIVKLKAKISY
jgi:hypothetical protein